MSTEHKGTHYEYVEVGIIGDGGHPYDPSGTSVEDLIAKAPKGKYEIIGVSTFTQVEKELEIGGRLVKSLWPTGVKKVFFKGELQTAEQVLEELGIDEQGWVKSHVEEGITQFVKAVDKFGDPDWFTFNPKTDQFKPELGVKK